MIKHPHKIALTALTFSLAGFTLFLWFVFGKFMEMHESFVDLTTMNHGDCVYLWFTSLQNLGHWMIVFFTLAIWFLFLIVIYYAKHNVNK